MYYYSNQELCRGLISKWRKMKPDNKELKVLEDNLLEITLYVVGLHRDNEFHKIAMSDYRERLNKKDLELQELKEKYDKMEKDYKKDFKTT